ncbi:urease accessory protein UreE [Ideonella sp. 4Y16]|uniref:Urease accessory protein UreE n=1 Tax=Ideonella alba TaxID=2824118 RepID=A0A940YBZ7_9BURK|nr:urease accessory protein UreE [Ideonella alba]MBQ0942125.1 urease accessory protein UreE [Ideonella alba]
MYSRRLPHGTRLAAPLLARAGLVSLDWDMRQKSRFDALTAQGERVLVVLPRGQVLRGGDVLVAEDGTLLRIEAAPQPVMRVRLRAGGQPFDLLRAAYHLGNRHVPLALAPDALLFEPDSVLAEMLGGLGLSVERCDAPFEPEGGAYGEHGHGHEGHSHSHGGHAHGEHHHDGHPHSH